MSRDSATSSLRLVELDGPGVARSPSNALLPISDRPWARPQVVDVRDLVRALDPGVLFTGDTVFCTDFTLAPCSVRVEPIRLQGVVIALLLNARKAIDGSGIVLICIDHVPTIRQGRDDAGPGWSQQNGRDDAGPGWSQIEVVDSGTRMGGDSLGRGSQPCFGTSFPGLDRGLGLAATQGIVRQNGGELAVTSVPGEGTTARIRFPSVASNAC